MPGYVLTNMVGHVSTRMHRWKSPVRHRSKQMLGELRVLPNKPLTMSEEQFKQNEEVILQKVLSGELKVTCPDGTTITSTPTGQLIYRSADGKETSAQNMKPAPVQPDMEIEAAPPPESEPQPEPLPEPPAPVWEEPKEEPKVEKKRRR